MNYFDCKIKILELKKQIFSLKEERKNKKNEIIEKNKSINKEGYAILNKLKSFYLDGYRRGIQNVYEFNLEFTLLCECYGADVISGSTEYMKRYNDVKNFDFHTKYCNMLELYIDIVKKFGTCNMNIFDPNFNQFIFEQTPIDEKRVVDAASKITQYGYDYKNISRWFVKNADILENIKDEWERFDCDNYSDELEEDFYDEQIKELKNIIYELDEYSKKLKERLV